MNSRFNLAAIVSLAIAIVQSVAGGVHGFEDQPALRSKTAEELAKPAEKLVPLNQDGTVLLDKPGKRLLLKSKVVLRDGLLEMLCCRAQTKEHESILAVDTLARVVHAGLLALGANPGSPVQFLPEFKPPTGQKIDVFVQWTDEKGKPHRAAAQSWVRHAVYRFYAEPLEKRPADLTIPERSPLRYDDKNDELSWYGPMTVEQRNEYQKRSKDKAYRAAIEAFFERSQPRQMEAGWVFAGSGFYVDEKTGERSYQAEGGDLICVANFPTAMIDVAVESSSSGEANLLFEAYTDRIPPVGTEVTIELVPLFDKPADEKPKTPAP